MHKPSAIVVFAKAPQPGAVKTRLIPALGDDGAAELAAAMLQSTLHSALASTAGKVILAQSPAGDNAAWLKTSLPATIERWDQGDGDLGRRLDRGARRALQRFSRVLLIGADAPGLTARHFDQALAHLAETDAVLTPAIDGGYALLGLTRFNASLFTDIPWSTSEVAARTRQRLAMADYRLIETAAVRDIDEPDDLSALPDSLRERLAATT